jgi:tRNA pseudouridine55 synthase
LAERGGVLIVDKPAGKTSHDVVAILRKKLKTRAVGHAGTLDPMATGVLVIAFDAATKLVSYLTAADKTYETTVRLGVTTDSLDADGRVVEEAAVPADWSSHLAEVMAAETARTEQVPPAVSAIHVDGMRAHERVRRGEAVELTPRPVRVLGLEVLGQSTDSFSVRITAAKGYYVRSFARDAATALGTVGHLTALRRVASGAFTLADAVSLDGGDLRERAMKLEQAAARALPTARLSERGVLNARVGRPLAPGDVEGVESDAVHAWLDASGTLIALGERRADGCLYVVRGF